MADNMRSMDGVNAMGVGNQDLRDSEGGNNSRGVLDQVRPTGIMATGRIQNARTSMERKGKGARAMGKSR